MDPRDVSHARFERSERLMGCRGRDVADAVDTKAESRVGRLTNE